MSKPDGKYGAQYAWQKRNGYKSFAIKTYDYIIVGIQALAKEKRVSVPKLIIDAIEGYYGVTLRKSQNESANSDEEE